MYIMPKQSQKKSQSKNGGRRRKSTMRKLRRGRKSRKVMRGGGEPLYDKIYTLDEGNNKELVTEMKNTYKTQTSKNFNPYNAQMEELRALPDDLKNRLKTAGFDVDTFNDI